MRDYSQYIRGFITRYEIVGDEILVYSPKLKNPSRYPLNEENLKIFKKILTDQYNLVIENKEIVLRDKRKKLNRILMISISMFVLLGIISYLLPGSPIIMAALLSTSLLSVAVTYIVNEYKLVSLEKEFDIYQKYISNMAHINEVSSQDKNIIDGLNDDSKQLIEEKKEVTKRVETSKQIFDIDLMDKMQLKQLKLLLTEYLVSREMFKERVFTEPKKFTKKKN